MTLDDRDREIAFLKALVELSFADGFECGESHNQIDHKYPPSEIAWLFSDARRELTGDQQEGSYADYRDDKRGWKEI